MSDAPALKLTDSEPDERGVLLAGQNAGPIPAKLDAALGPLAYSMFSLAPRHPYVVAEYVRQERKRARRECPVGERFEGVRQIEASILKMAAADPSTGCSVVPSWSAIVEAFVRHVLVEFNDGIPAYTVRRLRGVTYVWSDQHSWRPVSEDAERAMLHQLLGQIRFVAGLTDAELKNTKLTGPHHRLDALDVTIRAVSETRAALHAHPEIRLPDDFIEPTNFETGEPIDTSRYIPVLGGLVDTECVGEVDLGGALGFGAAPDTGRFPRLYDAAGFEPYSPSLFVLNPLPIEFDPAAPEPVEFLRFAREMFGGDEEQVRALIEWLGLICTTDVSFHSLMFLLGSPGSGKGTFIRLVQRMLGTENYAALSARALGGDFGLAQLPGKRVAVVSDNRESWTEAGLATSLERLLNLSGDDAVPVNRKFRDEYTARLHARVLIASNSIPRVRDGSLAIFRRALLLKTAAPPPDRVPDRELDAKLAREIPAIFNLALAGLGRLRERGRFEQPSAGQAVLDEFRTLAWPELAFFRDHVRPAAEGEHVFVDDLYERYEGWAHGSGHNVKSKIGFGRELRSYVEDVLRLRHKRDNRPRKIAGRDRQMKAYTSIALIPRDEVGDGVGEGVADAL